VTTNGISIELPRTADGRHADYAPAIVLALEGWMQPSDGPRPSAPAPFTQEWEDARHEKRMARIDRMKAEGNLIVDEYPPWFDGPEY
jgi:hypothetical protein